MRRKTSTSYNSLKPIIELDRLFVNISIVPSLSQEKKKQVHKVMNALISAKVI